MNEIRSKFLISPEITYLNHGSFGALPLSVFDAQLKYRKMMESSPVDFFLNQAPHFIDLSLVKLSELINSNPENLVFVDNATTGVNTILNSLMDYYTGAVEVIFFDSIYPAVRNSLEHLKKTRNIKLYEIELDYPVTKQQIIDEFEASVTRCTKIAIIDHISSSTAITFPVEELLEICVSKGIVSIIDGAHSVGQLNLDFKSIEYDFYISNCHKWLYSPRGTAFLWINDLYKEIIHPLSISLFYNQGLRKEFYWQGTRDVTPWCAVGESIDFFNQNGGSGIIQSNKLLNYKAKELIAEQLTDICADNSVNEAMSTHFFSDDSAFLKFSGNEIRNEFFKRYKIEVPFFIYKNKAWFRISCQIYNELSEYEYLIKCLSEFKNI